jgi:hypothetical protein
MEEGNVDDAGRVAQRLDRAVLGDHAQPDDRQRSTPKRSAALVQQAGASKGMADEVAATIDVHLLASGTLREVGSRTEAQAPRNF